MGSISGQDVSQRRLREPSAVIATLAKLMTRGSHGDHGAGLSEGASEGNVPR